MYRDNETTSSIPRIKKKNNKKKKRKPSTIFLEKEEKGFLTDSN